MQDRKDINIIEECGKQVIEYLRKVKGFKGSDKEIAQDVLESKINHLNFSMFSDGDAGIKRCKFMLKTLDRWKSENKVGVVVSDRIIDIYKNEGNPPVGLGNSIELRTYIAKALFAYLKLEYFPSEFESEKRNLVFMKISPSDDTVKASLMRKKVEEYIKDTHKPTLIG